MLVKLRPDGRGAGFFYPSPPISDEKLNAVAYSFEYDGKGEETINEAEACTQVDGAAWREVSLVFVRGHAGSAA